MDAAVQIGLVRENLALAIALWAAAERGVITAGFVPNRSEFVNADGRVVKVYTPLEVHDTRGLVRRVNNQVRGAFAFSAIQTNRVLEAIYGNSPIKAPQSDLQAARCILYLLSKSVSRDLLRPAWDCPPEYRRTFDIPESSFELNASQLDGKKVCWDHFGGLQKYLDLLEFCSAAVGSSPVEVQELPQAPAVTSPAASITTPANDETAPAPEAFLEVPATSAPELTPAVATVNAPDGPMESREPRLQDGLASPTTVPSAAGPDPFTEFVKKGCIVSAQEMIIAKELYDGYLAWCQANGHEPLPQRSFGMRLTALGFQRRRRGRGRHWWLGIRLARAE